MGRRGRRRKQLLGDLEEKRGYCELKDEALGRTVWKRSCTFCKTNCWVNDWMLKLVKEGLLWPYYPCVVCLVINNTVPAEKP